jgi:hypothetical protein
MRGLNRHHVQEFNPNHKEAHRARRKLKVAFEYEFLE